MPIYYFSLFRAPRSVVVALEKIMWDFFWEGADSEEGSQLVSWEMVCHPKQKGGLGIGNGETRSRALLMKWL